MVKGVAVAAGASLERLAAGVVMGGFPVGSVPRETRDLAACGMKNFILFGRNVGSRDAVRSLTADLQSLVGGEATIAIDHEGGRVMRLTEAATPWPSAMAWAATGDIELARQASRVAAEELASLGINLNFAPVADLLGDYRNPVLSTRCFSDNPAVTATFVSAFVTGHREGSVAATAKHFPGHGHTPVDSHLALPEVDRSADRLRDEDLLPFVAAIRAGVPALMISHVWYTHLDPQPTPASSSVPVLRLARDELGYDGVIVTDCLEMGAVLRHMTTAEAAVRALAAGADLAIVSNRSDRQRDAIDAIAGAVRDGRLPVARLEESHRRLDRLRRDTHGTPPRWPEDGPTLAREIARRAVTLVRNEGVVPLTNDNLAVVTFAPPTATQVEDRGYESRLGRLLRRRGRDAVEVNGTAPLESVLTQLSGADTVIVGTVRATDDARQRDVVRALLKVGKRVAVIALCDPFDLLVMPDVPCFIATYGAGEYEMEAALAVLFGQAEAAGTLPVTLPGFYRRRHGLHAAQ